MFYRAPIYPEGTVIISIEGGEGVFEDCQQSWDPSDPEQMEWYRDISRILLEHYDDVVVTAFHFQSAMSRQDLLDNINTDAKERSKLSGFSFRVFTTCENAKARIVEHIVLFKMKFANPSPLTVEISRFENGRLVSGLSF